MSHQIMSSALPAIELNITEKIRRMVSSIGTMKLMAPALRQNETPPWSPARRQPVRCRRP